MNQTITCKKRKFKTKIDAMLALASARWSGQTHGNRNEVRVYKCPFCHKWHLTSKKIIKEKNTFVMKKIFLTLMFVLFASISFAQNIQWYQATSFASKPYNSASWSDWQSSTVKICININNDTITIYSPQTQYYQVISQVQAPYDADGVQVRYVVRNVLNQTLYVRLRIENNGNSQLYVDFADGSIVYNIRRIE